MTRSAAPAGAFVIALLAAHFLLLFGNRLYPFVDIPNHLAAATIVRHYDEPSNAFAEHYIVDDEPKPNQIHLRFCSARIFPSVEAANRVYHALYLGLLVVSVALLVRAVDGDPWAIPLAALWAYNFDVHWGFASFIPGIPAVLLFVRLLIAEREHSTTPRRLAVMAALLGMFFVHALIALFGLLVFAAMLAVEARRDPSASLRRALLALPVAAAIAVWWTYETSNQSLSAAEFLVRYYAVEFAPTFVDRWRFLFHDHEAVAQTALGRAFAVTAPVAVALFAYAALVQLRRGALRVDAATRAVVLLAASAVTCGLLLPDRLPDRFFLWERFSVFFFLALVVLGSRAAVRPWIRRGAVVLLVVLHFAVYAEDFATFQRENREFTPELFPDARPGATLAALIDDPRYRGRAALLHFPSYFIVWKQGIASTALLDFDFSWIRRRRPSDDLPKYDPWVEDEPNERGYCDVDYLLVRGAQAESQLPARDGVPCFRTIRRAGSWTLVQRAEEVLGDGDREMSFYDPRKGEIRIGDAGTVEEIALSMIHQATHAKLEKAGDAAEVASDNRADYVRRMVEEEAAGLVASIEMKRSLERAGKSVSRSLPLEEEYTSAKETAVAGLRGANASAAPDEQEVVGKAAGLDAVVRGLVAGKVVVTGNEPVRDYYENTWDRQRSVGGTQR